VLVTLATNATGTETSASTGATPRTSTQCRLCQRVPGAQLGLSPRDSAVTEEWPCLEGPTLSSARDTTLCLEELLGQDSAVCLTAAWCLSQTPASPQLLATTPCRTHSARGGPLTPSSDSARRLKSSHLKQDLLEIHDIPNTVTCTRTEWTALQSVALVSKNQSK